MQHNLNNNNNNNNNMHMYAKIGASRSNRLFAVHAGRAGRVSRQAGGRVDW